MTPAVLLILLITFSLPTHSKLLGVVQESIVPYTSYYYTLNSFTPEGNTTFISNLTFINPKTNFMSSTFIHHRNALLISIPAFIDHLSTTPTYFYLVGLDGTLLLQWTSQLSFGNLHYDDTTQLVYAVSEVGPLDTKQSLYQIDPNNGKTTKMLNLNVANVNASVMRRKTHILYLNWWDNFAGTRAFTLVDVKAMKVVLEKDFQYFDDLMWDESKGMMYGWYQRFLMSIDVLGNWNTTDVAAWSDLDCSGMNTVLDEGTGMMYGTGKTKWWNFDLSIWVKVNARTGETLSYPLQQSISTLFIPY